MLYYQINYRTYAPGTRGRVVLDARRFEAAKDEIAQAAEDAAATRGRRRADRHAGPSRTSRSDARAGATRASQGRRAGGHPQASRCELKADDMAAAMRGPR